MIGIMHFKSSSSPLRPVDQYHQQHPCIRPTPSLIWDQNVLENFKINTQGHNFPLARLPSHLILYTSKLAEFVHRSPKFPPPSHGSILDHWRASKLALGANAYSQYGSIAIGTWLISFPPPSPFLSPSQTQHPSSLTY